MRCRARAGLPRLAAPLALAAAGTLAALLALEIGARLIEGYPLGTLRLPVFSPRRLLNRPPPRVLAPMAEKLGSAADCDPRWIDEPPPPLANRRFPHQEFVAIRRAVTDPNVYDHDLYSIWNRNFAERFGCAPTQVLHRLPMPLRVFDPVEPHTHPPYRHYPDRTTPGGLTTNRFGWRGPDVSLNKPDNTIRIAFVGASTTIGMHNIPFSYPEYVVHWLNRWAERGHPGIRFDGINAARAGINSTDIAAVVRQEVLPMEPDLIVYYEGANQFIFADHLAGDDFPPWGKRPSVWDGIASRLSPYSALVRRTRLSLRSLLEGDDEPPKPAYTLRWPAGVSMTDPDITRPDLPLAMSAILADLRSIRDGAAASGAELAVSSFVWFVRDGLRLDPVRQGFLHQWLNQRCWPYRYADLRRFADFQNLVLQRFALAERLPFIDLAKAYPDDVELFIDAIHFTSDGTRVQAWIVFQSLLPLVRERVSTGAWPRPDREPLAEHPNIRGWHDYVLPCRAAE